MARKGRDLFEVLRERSAGGRKATAPPRGAGAAAPSSAGAEIVKVGRDVAGWVKRRVGGEPVQPEPKRAGQNGLILVAVAGLALILGFVVGRSTSASPSLPGDLRRAEDDSPGGSARRALDGQQPEVVRSTEGVGRDRVVPDGIGRDDPEATRNLSTRGFPVLFCAAPESQTAFDLASWLRQQGLPRARVKPLHELETGELFYGVICYVTDPSQERDDLDKLRSLAGADRAPAFAPEFVTEVGRLTGVQDVTYGH